jgi:hypothetical protein
VGPDELEQGKIDRINAVEAGKLSRCAQAKTLWAGDDDGQWGGFDGVVGGGLRRQGREVDARRWVNQCRDT